MRARRWLGCLVAPTGTGESRLRRNGVDRGPVTAAHAEGVARLPPVHEDPFDRMLVAQSREEPLVLLTNDGVLAGYGETVMVVS